MGEGNELKQYQLNWTYSDFGGYICAEQFNYSAYEKSCNVEKKEICFPNKYDISIEPQRIKYNY